MSLNYVTSKPYLVLTRTQIVGDSKTPGKLDPGENAGIVTYVRNNGAQTATGTYGRLRTASPYITITDSMYTYGNIAVNDSANNVSDPYDVFVSPSTPLGTVVTFQLFLASAESTWTREFTQTVGRAPGTPLWGPEVLPNFPAANFVYGVAYDRTSNRIYVTDGYGRTIYYYTADSPITYLGSIPAPDTNCTDISYSRYDNTLYVTSYNQKRIWKINKTTGAVLRSFLNPANDYPVGLAFKAPNTLWLADRRASLGATQLLYVSDTLGNAVQYNSPVQGYYNSRCMCYDSLGNTFTEAQTWFNSTGTLIDSIGAVEYTGVPPSFSGRKFLLNTAWNIRGIESDPRDGSFWVTIPQGGPSYNMIVKVSGFYLPPIGVDETQSFEAGNGIRLDIVPNPARNFVSFTIAGRDASPMTARIYDVSGRIVREMETASSPAGNGNSLTWNCRDAQNRSVAPGIYFVRIDNADGTVTGKFIVTR